MTDEVFAPGESRVVIELLDAGHGRALQFWEFTDKTEIEIGRLPDQDVAIADIYVSRKHARLEKVDGAWRIVSLGQHGVVVNGALVQVVPIGSNQIFRLGANGPMLKFVVPEAAAADPALDRGSTMVSGVVQVLALDDLDTQDRNEKVGEIVESDFFRAIKEQASRLRQSR
jgi:hypothetical protein